MKILLIPLSIWTYIRSTLMPAILSCFNSRRDNAILTITLLVGVFSRGYFLSQPMRFDESTTYLAYSNGSIWDVFSYTAPNNHVLNTIFIKISIFLFGSHPSTIRLPAFTFGILAIILTFCLCKRLKSNGLVSALVVSVSPYIILFSSNARGYTLITCLSILLAIVVLECSKKPTLGGTYLISVIASLGLLTMPTMLFPIVGIYCWWFLLSYFSDQKIKDFLINYFLPSGFLIVPITILLYSPVIIRSGLKSIIANEYVESQNFYDFIKQLRWHIESTLMQYIRDIPTIFILMSVVLIGIGIYSSLRRKDFSATALLAALITSSVIVLFINHKIPFERTWIFLIPFIAIIADIGATNLYHRLGRLGHRLFIIIYILVLLLPLSLIANEKISKYEDTGRFLQGPIIGKYLAERMRPGDSVFIGCCENYSLFFYLSYFGVTPYTYGIKTTEGQNFYVVPQGKNIKDLTEEPVELLFEFDGTSIYK